MATSSAEPVEMSSSKRLQILKECKAALDSFLASDHKFRVISTVSGGPNAFTTLARQQPATLFILDSSFNPPSRAHASLAASAVAAAQACKRDKSGQRLRYPAPIRLLLLFSTHNADKEAKPAAFEHRLAMMVVFARDLSRKLEEQQQGQKHAERADDQPRQATDADADTQHVPDIDIGLTTEPYYHAKSLAIASASDAPPAPGNPQPQTQHIHLVGHDTITRIFAAKYYPAHTPPLSALAPFFVRHGLRATVRPPAAAAATEEAEAKAQLQWVDANLGSGALEAQGAQAAWAEQIESVEAVAEGRDISSTRVRRAVESGDWADVARCCTEGVVGWIKEFGLYTGGSG